MRELKLRLPDPPPSRPWAGVISLVAHVLVLALFVAFSGRTYVSRTVRVLLLPEAAGEDGPRAVPLPPLGQPSELPAAVPPPAAAPGPAGAPRIPKPALSPIDSAVRSDFGPFLIRSLADDAPVIRSPERPPLARLQPLDEYDERRIGTGRILGPAYGTGDLWVRIEAAQLGLVGPSGSEAEHVARVDSALREKIKAFIDTMPRDSFALPPPPVWTTEVAGRTWGMDRNWIYLGDFKLPTALLALLPFNTQANYDLNRSEQELLRIREIIHQAARRADNSKDFRKYIDDLRKRRDAERETERARAARAAQRDTVVP